MLDQFQVHLPSDYEALAHIVESLLGNVGSEFAPSMFEHGCPKTSGTKIFV